MNLPARRPHHPEIELSTEEADVYRATAQFLRDLYREGFRKASQEEEEEDTRRTRGRTGRGVYFLECLRLAQRLCSSTPALATSLTSLAEGELVLPEYRVRARDLALRAVSVTRYAKLQALEEMLKASPDQVVVFSEHLPTVDLIARRLEWLGRPAVTFTGRLSRRERHRALRKFRETPGAVLVSTRSGSEGLNLQFCHRLVNYELPWNPMVVEQRIGRVHRIGQTREVELHNYAARDTVEAHILRLLHAKIRLFELVVGELDLILDPVGADGDKIEGLLGAMWLEAESDEGFEQEIDTLGDALATRRAEALAEEARASEVAAEDSAGRLAREFASLTVSARLRLGYGTVHLHQAPGVESARKQLGMHVSEVLEALGNFPTAEPAGQHPDYGPLTRITGVTGAGRAVILLAQADRLPMTLVEIDGDPAAPLAA